VLLFSQLGDPLEIGGFSDDLRTPSLVVEGAPHLSTVLLKEHTSDSKKAYFG
jgi:hypothetical protein